MSPEFIRNRITQLRIKKDVSEYKMSLEMGHSKGYVQSISSGRALPSMIEFLYMCDYFNITPKEFFDEDRNEPILLGELFSKASNLNESDLKLLISLAERLGGQKEN